MQDNKTAQMREYLKLKQIQENDESDEIIEEVYNILNEHLKLGISIHPAGEWLLDNFYSLKEILNLSYLAMFLNEVRKEEK